MGTRKAIIELWLRVVKYPRPSLSSQAPDSDSSVKPAFSSIALTALTVCRDVGLLSIKSKSLPVSWSVIIIYPFSKKYNSFIIA